MADVLGFNVPAPTIDITGFVSNTWFYIIIVAILGFVAISALSVVLFLRTYNRRIIFFENVAGLGYQPTFKTRARIIKLGVGGEEILKTLRGGYYMSAYGRKMGTNTYWYAKGSDGYWYNFLLGDLDAKLALLDIEPIDRDVRMLHVALARLAQMEYGKQGWLEKYGGYLLVFGLMIIFFIGMWVIAGRIGDATGALADTAETNRQVVDSLGKILVAQENINNPTTSGIVPAIEAGT